MISRLLYYIASEPLTSDGLERLPMLCASRLLFEHVTRKQVVASDGVTIRHETIFTTIGPTTGTRSSASSSTEASHWLRT